MTCRRARRSGKATRRGCSALGAQPQPGLRQAMPPKQGANPAAAKAAEAKPKPKKGEAEKLLAAGKVDAAAAAIAKAELEKRKAKKKKKAKSDQEANGCLVVLAMCSSPTSFTMIPVMYCTFKTRSRFRRSIASVGTTPVLTHSSALKRPKLAQRCPPPSSPPAA